MRGWRAPACRLLARLMSMSMLAAGMFGGAAATGNTAAVTEGLDTAAVPTSLARRSALVGIAGIDNHLIAVGPRGHIIDSGDAAKTWRQAAVPVSTDLTTVRFVDAANVWAVGHDGVVLHSQDAGKAWSRILDGRTMLALMTHFYQPRAQAGDAAAAKVMRELDQLRAQSATPDVLPYPLLDVWFVDRNEGFVVGAFGLILHTVDGGVSWEPWIERMDNERRLHLYGIVAGGGQLYVVGEQGLVRRLDRDTQRFVAIETPYAGTYFGAFAADGVLIVYGLRGNAYASYDGGQQWSRIALTGDASIVAVLSDGPRRLLFISQAGQVFASGDNGRSITDLKLTGIGEVLGAASAGSGASGALALVGRNGIGLVQLPTVR